MSCYSYSQVGTYVISSMAALLTAADINCDTAKGLMLQKTLDEMLELEPGEDVPYVISSKVAPITAAVISCFAAKGQLL